MRFVNLLTITLWGSTLIAGASNCPAQTAVDNYPDHTIRLMVPFPPGSTTDSIARFLAEQVSRSVKQPVVVENKVGAQGGISAREFLKYPADGYAIYNGTNSTHAANVHLFKSLGYDPVKDFSPVMQLSINPLVLVINPELPVKNVSEFIEYAKKNPGRLNYGVANTSSQAAVQLLKNKTGIQAQDVNFTGTPQAITELVAGRIDFMFTDVSVTRPFIESGKLRALGVSTAEPLAALPGVPTISQAGIAGYEFTAWGGLFVPANTPAPIIARINQEFSKAMQSPEAKAFFARISIVPVPDSTPKIFAKHLDDQIILWGQLSEQAGTPKK